ncbi:MAG TPA: hypothetical protein VLX92_04945 [Kofleriaceae bacterium]|nr:hypothetical protein [Kofleriaceae bacterium]
MRLALAALLAACAAPPPPRAPIAPPSQCDQVADHLVSLMDKASPQTSEQLDPFRRVVAKRCTDDLWTAAARQCLLAITSFDQGDQCKTDLTQSQQDAFVRDTQAAFGDLRGSETAPGAAAPAPPPASKTSGDPCEGGQ